ncbi:hypothetical protein KP79_PYT24309 [Mizuhopecten yessoensis]|uniref:DUF6589 domain-containing protein n=1 Tax=Mizuhopecten yessoensis TaxID=6573 RepID=A0A210QRM1_MIZYE|nr:hypothetical protein KP79_PYT24309 [Mizuhopecten yessoensis]
MNKITAAVSLNETCINNIDEFISIHKRQKRMSTTPPSSLKMSDANQIKRSVEKLKCLSLNDDETLPKKSRQRLTFDTAHHASSTSVPTPVATPCPAFSSLPDHGYTKSYSTQSEPDSPTETSAEDFMKQLVCDTLPVIDKSVQTVAKLGKSILFVKDPNELCKRDWSRDVTREMYEKCPELFRGLCSTLGDKISAESKLSTMSVIYGMILHCRNVRACAIQRIISALCIRYHADNKVHVMLSHETKRNLLKDFSDYSDFCIIEKVNQGKDGKINDQMYKDSLKVLLGRIMTTYTAKFDWMKSILPQHIPHTLDDVMSQKSEICWLPVMLKNEACYSDCIQIMKSYEAQILQWYTKSGRACDLDKLKVPVGGDQLTRVRLQGAKAVQDGALTAVDRLEHLEPIIVELFHTLQDLLEKLYKRFYKTTSGRDKGTLFNLKVAIERSNIHGKVKGRFEVTDFMRKSSNSDEFNSCSTFPPMRI